MRLVRSVRRKSYGRRTLSETWVYHDDEVVLRGELFFPDSVKNGRAILVAHEADGIGGNVRRRCAMLRDLGYIAAAVDLHGDGRVLSPEEIAPAMMRFHANPPILRKRIKAGLDALAAVTSLPAAQIAAIGYCFGGLAVLELARSGAPVQAVASFHGLLTTQSPASPNGMSARVLACTGALDPLVPPKDIAAFQAEMTAAIADWQLVIYGGALHSFTNRAVGELGDPRMAYDPFADRQSWKTLLSFLTESFD
jgi:dienelactone hydrolase